MTKNPSVPCTISVQGKDGFSVVPPCFSAALLRRTCFRTRYQFDLNAVSMFSWTTAGFYPRERVVQKSCTCTIFTLYVSGLFPGLRGDKPRTNGVYTLKSVSCRRIQHKVSGRHSVYRKQPQCITANSHKPTAAITQPTSQNRMTIFGSDQPSDSK